MEILKSTDFKTYRTITTSKSSQILFYWKDMFNMSDLQPSNFWWQTSTKLTSQPSGRHCQYNRYPAMWRPPCECDVQWSSEGNFVSERLAKVGHMSCRACPLNEVVAGVKVLCKPPSAALKAEKSLYKSSHYHYLYFSIKKTRQIVMPAGTELPSDKLDKCQRAQV